jgi:hypothetical protein
MECLGLRNKPKAEVHPGHKLTGPKEEEGQNQTKKFVNTTQRTHQLEKGTILD